MLDQSSGQLDRLASDSVIDEITERAIETALLYKDREEATVTLLTMGPASAAEILRKGLAMGADEAVHILDDQLANADLMVTSAALAQALESLQFDLIIAGNESTDGRGGVIPALIAERLQISLLTYLDEVVISAAEVKGRRLTEFGSYAVHAALPAMISVTESSCEPRFPGFKGLMRAKKKPLHVMARTDLGLADIAPASTVVSTVPRTARAAGIKVIDSETSVDELVEFLAASRVI